VVGGARSLAEGATTAGRRLLENVAEFLLEERRVLVRPGSVDDFAGDITRLRDDVERTAKRIAKLEQKLAQRPAPATASSSTAIVPAPENALIPMPDNALIELPKTPDNTADS
jgi:ubiquinone biosynthesis protein UbiJ